MIEIYGKENCPFCDRAKELCEQSGYEYNYNQLDVDFNRDELLELFPDARTFPQITVGGEYIGGYQQFDEWHNTDWNEK
jgi:glutaredoxin|tara:strand:+ start:817 stop:1053 length:237 start_codon:yes stop_codon:yes gene_type:complete